MSDVKRRKLQGRSVKRVADEDMPLLEKLKPDHREVLKEWGSYEDIAESLCVPIGTVKSRIHRARAALAVLKSRKDEGEDGQKAE